MNPLVEIGVRVKTAWSFCSDPKFPGVDERTVDLLLRNGFSFGIDGLLNAGAVELRVEERKLKEVIEAG